MIDAYNLKRGCWILLGILILFLALTPSNLPYFGYLFFFTSFLALAWTLYLIYICESYTIYMASLLISAVGSISLLASSAAYFAAAKFWGKESILTVMTGLSPLVLSILMYLFLASTKPTFHPFEYDGIKVQTRPQTKKNRSTIYNPAMVAGITTLAASMFIKLMGSLTSGLVATLGLITCSLTLLFYARHVIRGLRLLRIKEKTMSSSYTFMQIDEIRDARNRWWLGRLFKWATARGRSSDN
ncbi:hypothetical protein ALP72_00885 [Pseudomonas coronafaciens pv. coronafaciens]|uniref:Uncharacterized protein n=2 Tax=Pseudomonas TaxID=286 RepID=A0AAE6UQ02_9PSED|nr:hypothetical protein [Pseudomonas tremae]MCF5810683.1 hypothetical protein [Pseudomonas tremae]QGT84311.1 hypothetical protein GMO17_25760 [Pseudomonas coronafaciens pv. coronafaciens]QIQ72203.1 hypothetical protein HBB04_02596 [Pseudomonas coronafaciens]RMS08744.1 hypothetical protein ALP72_00885 [Pseudomonas coronafaciens pv. coronafaciens]